MAPNKMAATLKVHKWHNQNVCVRLVKGLHKPYQAFSQTAEALTLLENIAQIPDWQVVKAGKLSIFWLLYSPFFLCSFRGQHNNSWYYCNDSNMKQTEYISGVTFSTYILKKLKVVGNSQVTLYLRLLLFWYYIIASTPPSSTEYVFR